MSVVRAMLKGVKMKEEHIDLTAEDFRDALKVSGGYVDITEEDLIKLYEAALKIGRERCTSSWLAGEIMTREVVSVTGDIGVHEAGRLLIQNKISGMPVVDAENRVIGMVSSADLMALAGIPGGHVFSDAVMKYVLHHPAPRHKPGKMVKDIMTGQVIMVMPDTAVGKIAELLDKKGITRGPVVDSEHRLQGIVSRADIIRIICEETSAKGL